MRTTVTVDDELMAKAEELTGIKVRSALVRSGIEALIARESVRRLALLGGCDPQAQAAPRARASMILVDTSVWIDHLHQTEPQLEERLTAGLVAQHPMIVGELALGSLQTPALILELLTALPAVPSANQAEVMHIETERLYGRDLSLVDAHLLTSPKIAPAFSLWSRDRKLRAAAGRLGIAVA